MLVHPAGHFVKVHLTQHRWCASHAGSLLEYHYRVYLRLSDATILQCIKTLWSFNWASETAPNIQPVFLIICLPTPMEPISHTLSAPLQCLRLDLILHQNGTQRSYLLKLIDQNLTW